jgi:hypothetical protein
MDSQTTADGRDRVELQGVPFFAQDAHQCGPAALATVLVAAGVAVTPAQLLPQVYLPERQGSLQAELMAASRRHERVAYRMPESLLPLFASLQEGRPVLVLLDVGWFQRWPVWHYAVLVGYDKNRNRFLLRSAGEPRQWLGAKRFMSQWAHGGRWAMVVVQAEDIPALADALPWLRAVEPFEAAGKLAVAARGYTAATARWPDDPAVWTALGNVRYRQQRLSEAEAAYVRALTPRPLQTPDDASAGDGDADVPGGDAFRAGETWVARNNLVRVLVERGCRARAQHWSAAAGEPPPALAAAWTVTLASVAASVEHGCAQAEINDAGQQPSAAAK